jgi:glycosyltransferase involved in cell wall biosynthesis
MPYMVREGETGFLVDPDDSETLAERIVLLLSDKERRAQMSRAARQEAGARWHPENVAQRTLRVYEKLLAASAARYSNASKGSRYAL